MAFVHAIGNFKALPQSDLGKAHVCSFVSSMTAKIDAKRLGPLPYKKPSVIQCQLGNSNSLALANTKESEKPQRKKSHALFKKLAIISIVVALGLCIMNTKSAYAQELVTYLANAKEQVSATAAATATATGAKAAMVAEAEQHVGHKIAAKLRTFGVPDLLVLMIISALPVVELRGGVPVGYWMGLDPVVVFIACVLGNFLPMIPLAFALKTPFFAKVFNPFVELARSKLGDLETSQSPLIALAVFIGVPLPGTGAWTGLFIAHILGMRTDLALLSIFAGVVMAGIIVVALCELGMKGALIACIAMIGAGGSWIAQKIMSGRSSHGGDAQDHGSQH